MRIPNDLPKAISSATFLLIVLGMMLVMFPGTPVAQEDEYVLEDTVVTATKTGETDLQTTSISITVFDEEYLSDLGTYNLRDLETFVSSFEYIGPGRTNAGYIRGIGTSIPDLSGEAGIAYYIDGVYLDQGRGANADFMDMERIEILKGPQGVVFGGNATGGAINFITRKPTDELELTGRIEVGNYAMRRIDARIAGPLMEGKLRGSLTFMDAEHDGYIDNLSSERDGVEQNDWGVRGKIQVLPSDSVEITLSADYAEKKYTSPESKNMYITPRQSGHINQAIADGYPLHYIIPEDFWTVNVNEEHTPQYQEDWGLSLHMDFKLPHDMTLTSITARREQSVDNWQDRDDLIHRLQSYHGQQDQDQTSQELILNGSWGELDFLLGGFYFESFVDSPLGATRYPHGWLLTWGTPWFGLPIYDDNIFSVDKQNWAFFTNLTYAVTDKLNLSAGIRYSDESKDFFQARPNYLLESDGSAGPFLRYLFDPITTSGNWTVWTPKFTVEYQANEDIFLFGSYAEGFKGGQLWGLNELVGMDAAVDPEYVETWELGVKTDWLDRRLRVNAALFTNEHTDFQSFIWVVLPSGEGIGAFANIGSVESTGVELDVIARPIDGLTLNANVSYLNAEYGEWSSRYRFDKAAGNQDVSGRRLPNIPEWKATLGASYTLTLEDAGFVTFGTNIAYRDDVPMTAFEEDPYAWKDDYTIVNATIRYETQDGKWALEGYARNLFETKYYRSVNIGSGVIEGDDATYYSPGDPRRIGIKVTYNFRADEKREKASPPPPPPPPPPAPKDSDGDGVYDDRDRCPNTPKGVKVDSFGCPLDSDGDGVPDYKDQCPDTPKGVKVDREGCPLDTDGDGVADHLDQCPNTPIGATVDERGCWTYSAVVLYDFDSAEVKPEAYPMLQEAISIMEKNPDLKVEVEGHADSTGPAAYNMTLSERRAEAVRDYFVSQGIDPHRLTTKGFGITKPAASNDTEEGRAKNRRVELTPVL